MRACVQRSTAKIIIDATYVPPSLRIDHVIDTDCMVAAAIQRVITESILSVSTDDFRRFVFLASAKLWAVEVIMFKPRPDVPMSGDVP